MNIRWIAPFLLLLPIAVPAEENATAKHAWQMTLDERLTARNDPAAAQRRLREALTAGNISTTENAFDFISGRTHPELLLSWELFDNLMTLGFADDPEARSIYRESKDSRASRAALPPDFWERLGVIGAAYLADVRRLRDLHSNPRSDFLSRDHVVTESSALERFKCRDRADAIAAARHEFGEAFDRFLYEAVAPNMMVSIMRGGRSTIAREHEIERGCR